MNLKDDFRDFIEKNNISQRQAADGIGKSATTINQWFNDKYAGDVPSLEESIRRYIARESNRLKLREMPIVATENFTRIKNALSIGHEDKSIVLIVGDAGLGKTVALRSYNDENPHSSIYIEVNDTYNKKIMLKEIARALSIDNLGNISDLSYRIVNRLNERDYIVIIDQADYLNDGVLELLRHIVKDKGNSGLALCGLPRFVYRIDNIRNDHAQIASRIGIYYSAKIMKETDAKKIMETLWPEVKKEVVKEAAMFADGSFRVLGNLIKHVQRYLIANRLTSPDAEIISVASQDIFRKKTRK